MNNFQIWGTVLSLVATGLMFYGSYLQSRSDGEFQNSVSEFVQGQKELNKPQLEGLKVNGSDSEYRIVVKNVGNIVAKKVKLIFKESSMPAAFSANTISGAEEIHAGVEYEFPLNLFSGINLLLKTPNTDAQFKMELQSTLDKFNSGQMALIPRFYLEYYHGNQKIVSEDYYLVIEKKNGVSYLGKESK